MQFKDFKVVAPLGKGGFGDVLLCKTNKNFADIETNQLVAMKVVSKKYIESIINEINVLKQMKGKLFTSQILGSFQDRFDVFIVLRLEENGSLADMLDTQKKLVLQTAQSLIVDIALGLHQLHKLDILHGDLKPANILIDINIRAHLADFGLSRNYKKDPVKGMYGTPNYQSPEQYFNIYHLDERVDIFILGVFFNEMITGQLTFSSNNDPKEAAKNCMLLNYTVPSMNSSAAISFIKNTLCEASSRLNKHNIMKHPFIKPIIQSAINGFECPRKYMFNGDCDIYHTNKNMKTITGIDYENKSLANVGTKHGRSNKKNREPNDRSNRQSLRQRNQSIPIDTNNQPNGGRVVKRNRRNHTRKRQNKVELNYFAVCHCNKRFKVVVQRGSKRRNTNYVLQPYERHFDRCH